MGLIPLLGLSDLSDSFTFLQDAPFPPFKVNLQHEALEDIFLVDSSSTASLTPNYFPPLFYQIFLIVSTPTWR